MSLAGRVTPAVQMNDGDGDILLGADGNTDHLSGPVIPLGMGFTPAEQNEAPGRPTAFPGALLCVGAQPGGLSRQAPPTGPA